MVTLITALTGKFDSIHKFSSGIFRNLFTLFEVFIYLESPLVADLNFGKRPGEITRIVFFSFIIFQCVDEKHTDLKNLS